VFLFAPRNFGKFGIFMIDPPNSRTLPGSIAAMQCTVNARDVGSNPALAAKTREMADRIGATPVEKYDWGYTPEYIKQLCEETRRITRGCS
jgi:hypothetical protein